MNRIVVFGLISVLISAVFALYYIEYKKPNTPVNVTTNQVPLAASTSVKASMLATTSTPVNKTGVSTQKPVTKQKTLQAVTSPIDPVEDRPLKIQTKLTMEDLILQPNEVPAGYVPLKVLALQGIANPGFMTGETRNEILSEFGGLGASSARVGRVYGAIYKLYEENMPPSDLSIIVLEYKNTVDLEADLANMRAINETMSENSGTFTVVENYIICINGDELVNELTQQLKAKITK